MAVTSLKRTRRRHKDSRVKRDLDADLMWERPGDWPQLAEVLPSQHKFTGLYKVENHYMNHVAMVFTQGSGTYHVDWGDGTSEDVGSGAAAQHTYDYTDTDLTLTSEGFKVAVVTVTPNGGLTFTAISLNQKSSNYGSNTGLSSGWLEMKFSTPSISNQANFSIGNSASIVHRNCRSFEYVGDCALVTGTNLFVGFTSLEQLKVPPSFTANMTTMTTMFSGLARLKYIPDLNTPAMTGPASLFAGCTQLRRVPALDYSHCTTMSAVFQNCASLEYIPDLGSIGNANTTSSLFAGCFSLKAAPTFTPSSSLAITTNMYLNCAMLRTVPLFNTSFVTNMTSMFQGCSSLEILPAFDLSAVNSAANFTNTFASLGSLRKLLATGARFGHTIPGQLGGPDLDVYYTNLGTASGTQTLTVSGNFTATDTPSIATAKGWTVTPP